jgi:apolipoprotein N-acyltransferase
MLIPLFYAVLADRKNSFLKASVFGFTQGLILLSWMVSAVGRYTGEGTNIGFILWVITALYFALVAGLQVWLITLTFKQETTLKNAWWLKVLVAGCIWIIIDWVRVGLTPGVPWMHYQLIATQCKWIIPLQITSFTGVSGLTFLIVVVNILIADSILIKNYYRIALPVAIYVLLITTGYLRLQIDQKKQGEVRVALICENLDAKQRWSADNGDSLAGIFFDLNEQAVKTKPNLIVWGESAIPWKLATNDDLITRCLEITWPSSAGHILGIFSPSEKEKGKIYNSAFYIQPDGAITGKYDKMQLLSFLEEPFGGKKLPFFKKSARTDIIPGEKRTLLKTPFGKAGVLICNETLAPNPFRETLELGADFFVVMSNDAWFTGSKLIDIHFYYNRLRAIESGIDMIVNSNGGISGIIDYKGRIKKSDISAKPVMLDQNISIRKYRSFYAKHGDWFIIISFLSAIVIMYKILKTKTKHV